MDAEVFPQDFIIRFIGSVLGQTADWPGISPADPGGLGIQRSDLSARVEILDHQKSILPKKPGIVLGERSVDIPGGRCCGFSHAELGNRIDRI